jgi:hypothetical protein
MRTTTRLLVALVLTLTASLLSLSEKLSFLQQVVRNKNPVNVLPADVVKYIHRHAGEAVLREKDKDTDMNLLHVGCASRCSVDVLRALVEACPATAFEADKYSMFPLHYAVEGSKQAVDVAVLAMLLRCAATPPPGVDDDASSLPSSLSSYPPACADRTGRLPLHHVSGASSVQPLDVVRSVLEAYPDAAGVEDSSGRLPVRYAVDRQLPEEVVELLLSAYPRGAHLLLIRALGAKEWGQAEALLRRYPEAAAVRSKNGKLLPLGVAVNKKAPLPVLLACVEAYPAAVTAERAAIGGFDFMTCFEAAAQVSTADAARLLQAVSPVDPRTGDEDKERRHGFWWTHVLSQTQDRHHAAVDLVLLASAAHVQVCPAAPGDW